MLTSVLGACRKEMDELAAPLRNHVKGIARKTFWQYLPFRAKRMLRSVYFECVKLEYAFETRWHNKTFCTTKPRSGKCLYVSPVGKSGKEFLKNIINKFGDQKFDYLIFVYDDATFSEREFSKCTFIFEKGFKWQFMKKHLVPDIASKYDYIFIWDDDIEIGEFSAERFLAVMERNKLEFAQPALTSNSYYSHKITLQDSTCRIGRYTDFVEIMVPVFKSDAWVKFWSMIRFDENKWGWGYDYFARSICKFKNMGIVDCETVSHVKPLRGCQADTVNEKMIFAQKNQRYKTALMLSYLTLK